MPTEEQRSDSHGRVAIVTGGCRGIGWGITQRLAADGMTVFAWDLPDSIKLAQNEGLAVLGGGSINVMEVDVSDETAVDAAVLTISDECGRIDALVNNAGISPKTDGVRTPPDLTTTDEWNKVIAVNLSGPFFCIRAVAPHMKTAGWGRIVNISSTAGRSGAVVAGLPYGAAKTGINGITRTLAPVLGPHGITVNSIAPGWIQTPMTNHAPADIQKGRLEAMPVRRPGQPADIAGLVSYLCRDESGFLTGDTIDMNGGAYRAP